ncbi:MAG: YdcF family protein [Gammaproteobacteria bacterium]
MSVSLVRILENLIMPPLGPLLLLALGALLLGLRRRGGATLLGIGWLGLYLVSTPLVSLLLAGWLETYPALTPEQLKARGAQAIVVISADSRYRAPEYGSTTSGRYELERIRYAAYLQRKTQIPLAVIGADPYGEGEDSSDWIRRILEQEFGVPVRWYTTGSYNTREDARLAADLLRRELVDRVALVTHAAHMKRAVWSFQQAGLEVIPAPTVFYTQRATMGWLDQLLPSANALHRNRLYLHELLGAFWYRLREG